jgi:Putative transposase
VLAYLARYTHRVAIANSRLVAFDGERVSFKYKDYRANGDARGKIMILDTHEFIRRFLLHVLPGGFHRIRHYGFLANGVRVAAIAKARALLGATAPDQPVPHAEPEAYCAPCPCCGGRMIAGERFERGYVPSHAPLPFQIDTS